MNYFQLAIEWILDPAHATGPNSVPTRVVEHLQYTLVAVVLAAAIGIPLGYLIGHTGRGRTFVVASSGAARALPTLGVLTLIALLVGIGPVAPTIALMVLAVPSILAGAYSGIDAIDRQTIDAARAIGMSEPQILARVEAPLGLPLLLGGLRSATLQVLATATLAAYVGGGGLGRFLFLGLSTQDYAQMLAAAILVIGLAIVVELVFEVVQRLSVRLVHARPHLKGI